MEFKDLFSANGRMNRQPYWLTVLGIAIVYMLVGGAVAATEEMLLLVLMLPLYWVVIMTVIKRFHDLGRSGWHYFTLMIPLYNIWVSIEIGFFRGTKGDNKYGPDPLGAAATAADEPPAPADGSSEGGGEPSDGRP